MNRKTNTTPTQPSAKQIALWACSMLVIAYKNGEHRGGEVDWQDVNDAWKKAKQALRIDLKESKNKSAPKLTAHTILKALYADLVDAGDNKNPETSKEYASCKAARIYLKNNP